jgi:hypothetical protein
MMRPLPPFRARPLRTARLRKTYHPALTADYDEPTPITIKTARRPLKAVRNTPRLRVIGRTDDGPRN